MNYFTMKNGTVIPFNTNYIVCVFSETIISSKTGGVIYGLGDEIQDYLKAHLEFLKGMYDEV